MCLLRVIYIGKVLNTSLAIKMYTYLHPYMEGTTILYDYSTLMKPNSCYTVFCPVLNSLSRLYMYYLNGGYCGQNSAIFFSPFNTTQFILFISSSNGIKEVINNSNTQVFSLHFHRGYK